MRHIKWLKSFLIIIFVFVIGGTGWAESEDSKYVKWYKTPIRYKYISIEVITKCLGGVVNWSYHYCPIDEQKIIFENNRKNIKKEINSSSPKDYLTLDEFESFLDEKIIKYFGPSRKVLDCEISGVTFYENKNGKIFFEVYYYCGGNCAQCEYYELYNEEGQLIATDRERRYLDSRTKKFAKVVNTYRSIKKKLGLNEKKSKSFDIYLEGGKQ